MCSGGADTAQDLTGLLAGGAAAAGEAAALPASAPHTTAAAAPAHEAIDLTGSDDEAARHAPAGGDPGGNPGVPDYGLLGLPHVPACERGAASSGGDGGGGDFGLGGDHLWGYSPALAALEASRRPGHGALAGIEAAVARPGEPADPARASAASLAQAEATEASLRALRVRCSPQRTSAGGPAHLQPAPVRCCDGDKGPTLRPGRRLHCAGGSHWPRKVCATYCNVDSGIAACISSDDCAWQGGAGQRRRAFSVCACAVPRRRRRRRRRRVPRLGRSARAHAPIPSRAAPLTRRRRRGPAAQARPRTAVPCSGCAWLMAQSA